MTRILAIAGLAVLLGAVAASAEMSDEPDRFMQNMRESVYATEGHLWFSVRTAIIAWLGGVPVVDEREVRAAEREGWWGRRVHTLPADERAGRGSSEPSS